MSPYNSRSVLVTGAGGSIGSALCSKLLADGAHVTGLARSERSFNAIPNGCTKILGNTTDEFLMTLIMRHVDVVIHCAAHKHVAICEANPDETHYNNVNGLANVLHAARLNMVRDFIFLSTDKAHEPTSVYGKTKAQNERQIEFASRVNDINYKIVRLCNVAGTSGSVFEIWQRQIKEKKPITVTDPEATRYFIDMPIAVDFILDSLSKDGIGPHVPQNIPCHRIMDLAQQIVAQTGTMIEVTGLRPGEKLHETLVVE